MAFKLIAFASVAAALAAFLGCARYTAQPITSQAVEKVLASPAEDALRVQATAIKHPILKPVEIDIAQGITPEQAAVIAVLVNPTLRAKRDERGIARAELLEAGLLPNPSLSLGAGVPFKGPDHITAYDLGATWDIASLVTRKARNESTSAHSASVDLDVAWEEWQVAQAARGAAYAWVALDGQLATAREVEDRLVQNLALIKQGVDKGQATAVDLAAAQAAVYEAHATVLDLAQKLAKQRLSLKSLLGLKPGAEVKLHPGITLPSRLDVPSEDKLLEGLEDRRLDLLALKRGYESQDASVRAAVLGRFPRIELGLSHSRDTAGVYTLGPTVGLDLPVFDRNQGNVAIAVATRQQLFDEYASRVFEARGDVAAALADLASIADEIAADEEALPILQNLVDTYEKALAGGHVDVLSYYGAKNDLAKKSIELIALKAELVATRIDLEIAAGEYLGDLQPKAGGSEARASTAAPGAASQKTDSTEHGQ